MNALDEICFLEQQIHDLVRASQDYEGRAVRARMDIKKLQEALEKAMKDRSFQADNVRHVKLASTDYVILEDFAKSRKNLIKAQTICENAKVGILQAEALIARCQEEVAGNDRRIATMRAKLAEYGEIIEFPAKKES